MNEEVCAVVIESIQGVGGIHVVSNEFWSKARDLCTHFGAVLVAPVVCIRKLALEFQFTAVAAGGQLADPQNGTEMKLS